MKRPERFKRLFWGRIAVVGLLLFGASCASIGPKTIPRDQFDYGTAIRNASKNQLLYNIVGLRYLEAPMFVNIASVINQYSLEGEVALGAGVNNSFTGENAVTLGGAGRFADRPTITYNPVAGRKFAESLMTPVSPEALFALVQAGWRPEFILRLTVRSMNGVDNEWASPTRHKQADSRFAKLLGAWGRLRNARAIGLRREGEGKEARIIVYKTGADADPEVEADLQFLFETLELDPTANQYTLSYGLVPDEPNEIVVLTSSIVEIMNELAWRVDVPEEHVEDGRTAATLLKDDPELGPLIRILHSAERPEHSYAAIRDRDYWYYIEDGDVMSKRTFAIVQIMLSLTDTGEGARGPVVSIGN
jgi:hypothetical protein